MDYRPPVGIIRLNRPHVHNALDGDAMTALGDAVAAFNGDTGIRSVVITASGTDTFCAGGDLRYFATLTSRQAAQQMSNKMQAILMEIENAPKPYIAAIQGNAFGGGCELALACHLRVMGEDKWFAFRQGANGIITGWGGGKRLFRLVSPSIALEWLLSSRQIPALELQQQGIVHRVVSSSEVMDAALQWATELAKLSSDVMRVFLQLYHLAMKDDWETFARIENEQFVALWENPAFQQFLKRWHKK